MHQSSFDTMSRMLAQFSPKNITILDVGATHNMWNYKSAVEANNCQYKNLDWGSGADYTVNSYDWSHIPTNQFDCVISGQAFEHDKYWWRTVANIKKIVKPGAIVIFILPSCGAIHRYPVDCYRFYPDSAEVFSEILNAEILEVHHNSESEWGDLAMAFKVR